MLADALFLQRKRLKRQKRELKTFLKKVAAVFGTKKAYSDYSAVQAEIDCLKERLTILGNLEQKLFEGD